MADTKHTLPVALHKLSVALKEKLAKFETDVVEMRARELASKEGKLAKHELCPLCGGADRNGICNCLRKNAVMGYPNSQGDASMTKHSSSASALAPAAPKPQTSVSQANKEMGGFRSLANDPTGPARTPAPMPGKKFNIGAAGRGNPATATASGTIGKAEMSTNYQAKIGIGAKGGKTRAVDFGNVDPKDLGVAKLPGTKKAEKNMGSARSPYGTGAAGHASTKNMPSSLRANINQNTNHSGDERMKKDELPATKAVPEKKVDGAKMPKAGKKIEAKGSGGQLRKDALPARAPEGAGVGGRQPVGQGGGDAHKTAASAGYPKAKLPLAGVGAKGVPQGPPKSVDVDVSSFDKGPAKPSEKFSALQTAGRGEVKRMIADKGPTGNPNAPAPGAAAAQLKADKQAGGVGFLNALIRKFRPLAPAQGQQGSLTSQRFHGTTALRRSEKLYGGKGTDMKKAALALNEMGTCPGCKDKDHPGVCKGLSGMNHNRTMLKVSTKRSAKKSR